MIARRKQLEGLTERRGGRRFLSAPRMAVRAAAVAMLGVILLTASPGAAHAAPTKYKKKESPCSNAISAQREGGKGVAHIQYNAYRESAQKFIVESATSWAGNFELCAQGTATTPYRIKVAQHLRFTGQSLECASGIQLSFPTSAGVNVTCTQSGRTVTVVITTTCAVRKSSCKVQRGYTEVLADRGANFDSTMKAMTNVVVTNADGEPIDWSTPYA